MFQEFLLSSRKDLLNLLDSLGVGYSYDASKEDLARLASTHIQSYQISPKNRQGHFKFISFCKLIFLVSISLVFIFSLIDLYLKFHKKPIYCDSSTNNSNCIRCPSLAKCINHTAFCRTNYILINNLCVFNDTDIKIVSKLYSESLQLLRKRAGDYHCELINYDYMSLDELDNALFKSTNLQNDIFEEIFHKTTLHLRNDNTLLFKFINGKEVIVSSEAQRDFRCRVKQQIYSHLNEIAIFTFVSLILFALTIFIRQKQRNKMNAKSYSNLLLRQLKNSKTAQPTENLKRELNNLSHNRGRSLWPHVESFLSDSPNVQRYNNEGEVVFRYHTFK